MRLGADPSQLASLAGRLDRDAHALRRAAADLAGATTGVWWLGRSRQRLDDAATRVNRALRSVADALGAAADDLRSQARQQAAASGGPGASAVRAVGAHAEARVLDLDARGDGRIVAAVGDPDRAAELVVLVPGAGTSLSSTPTLLRRAEVLREATARRLGRPSDDVAVIAWLGYDAPGPFDEPGDVLALATDDAARDGARDLRTFLARCRPDQEVVVLGHSYGSLVAALAAGGNRSVDRLVVVGSPGLGVDRAADLRLAPGVTLVAGASALDPVAHLGWFGRPPTEPGFGARVIDLTDRRPGRLADRVAHAHSAAFDPGSPALATLADALAVSATRAPPPPPRRPAPQRPPPPS